MHEAATFNKLILPLHVELDVNNLICLWFVFQISSALPWSAAISVDRLRHDCQSQFNHSAASVTLHSDEGSWRPLKTMFPRSSLCPYNIFFWLFFSPPTSPSLSLFLFTLLNPVSSPGTRSWPLGFLIRPTPLVGAVFLCVCYLRGRKSKFNHPT